MAGERVDLDRLPPAPYLFVMHSRAVTQPAKPSMNPQPIAPPTAGEASRAAEYRAPQLAVYGRLADVTAAVGPRGKNDHSGGRRTGY